MHKKTLATLMAIIFAALPARGDDPRKPDTAKPAAVPRVVPAAARPHADPAAAEPRINPELAAPRIRPEANAPAGPLPPDYQGEKIIPEVSTQITLSSSDANRIVCSQEIKDVIFSSEKGVSVKVSGRNAFVKFRIQRKDDRDMYSQTPTELFVVCGESVYSLIAVPKRIPAQTVRLSPGAEKIRKNAAQFGNLPFEKKVMAVIRAVYTGDVPDGFTETGMRGRIALFRDLDVALVRSFRVHGEGLRVKEFMLSSRKTGEEMKITEKDFLKAEIARRPLGIALDRHTLRQGETGRLIVVEKALGAGEGGGNGVQGED